MKHCLTTALLCMAVSFERAPPPAATRRPEGPRPRSVRAATDRTATASTPSGPKLAGQHADYLAKQIRDLKAGVTRSNALMAPMIAGLSDQDIEDIATYYAVQWSTGGFASEELHALGERIYRGGNMESGVPACIACHGPRGGGNGPAGFPSLAGQHAVYTAKQLEDWRTGARANDPNGMMADAVRYLTPRR